MGVGYLAPGSLSEDLMGCSKCEHRTGNVWIILRSVHNPAQTQGQNVTARKLLIMSSLTDCYVEREREPTVAVVAGWQFG